MNILERRRSCMATMKNTDGTASEKIIERFSIGVGRKYREMRTNFFCMV